MEGWFQFTAEEAVRSRVVSSVLCVLSVAEAIVSKQVTITPA